MAKEKETVEEISTPPEGIGDASVADPVVEAQPEPAPTQAPAAQVEFSAHAPIGSKARAMRDKLAEELKVRVFIPLAAGEKQGVTQSVILNGYPMYIRKGTYVDVPQSVAEVLEVKLKHKMTVENHPSRIKSDGNVELTGYGN